MIHLSFCTALSAAAVYLGPQLIDEGLHSEDHDWGSSAFTLHVIARLIRKEYLRDELKILQLKANEHNKWRTNFFNEAGLSNLARATAHVPSSESPAMDPTDGRRCLVLQRRP